MKIVIDCLGGDNSPQVNVEGALRALQKHDDLELILAGDEAVLRGETARLGYTGERVSYLHAPGCITGNDKPTDAIRHKTDSSLIAAVDLLRRDSSVGALVSIGATGAIVAAATLRVGRIKGVKRPTLCPLLPTMAGGIVGICDSGANVDVTPGMLQQFAVMGSLYLQSAYAVEFPRVALLNVGTEPEKGDELRKKTYPLLQDTPEIRFVGNMESRDLLTGKYDLVVCDGFAGNVLAKTTEGTALELLKKLKKDIMTKTRYKLGALFLKPLFLAEREFMNYQNYGGSVLLGCERTVVKGHGSSDATAVSVCVEQAYRMEKSDLNGRIATAIRAIRERAAEDSAAE